MKQVFSATYTLEDLPAVVKDWIAISSQYPSVYLFRGQMGAGKTTFIKEMGRQLTVLQSVQSPTFSLVNEYQTTSGEIVYHFDLYRLKNVREALDIGIEEYLDSGHLCLIEWPEQAEELWDFPRIEMNISTQDEKHRHLTAIWHA